jgi:hypothetical protein
MSSEHQTGAAHQYKEVKRKMEKRLPGEEKEFITKSGF